MLKTYSKHAEESNWDLGVKFFAVPKESRASLLPHIWQYNVNKPPELELRIERLRFARCLDENGNFVNTT